MKQESFAKEIVGIWSELTNQPDATATSVADELRKLAKLTNSLTHLPRLHATDHALTYFADVTIEDKTGLEDDDKYDIFSLVSLMHDLEMNAKGFGELADLLDALTEIAPAQQ